MSEAKFSTKIVLAVDDEPLILELLGAALRAQGYQFLRASNGQTCLDMLAAGKRPDVIILDWAMPGMDGQETCRRIRADHPGLDVPVIFLTAKQSGGDVKAALSAGANDFLIKPFQVETVLKRVERWLARG